MSRYYSPRGASIDVRLRDRVVVNDESCWIWQGRIDDSGYGRIKVGSRQALAHRVAHETWIGPIPDDMTVDHLCFVTSCINPQHLRLLTWSENSANQRSFTGPECPNGHEYTAENTVFGKTSTGRTSRTCRTCAKARQARCNAIRRLNGTGPFARKAAA